MSEARMWVRWTHATKASKWHIAGEGEHATLCGRVLSHEQYEVKETKGVPVDDYGVCAHCWRSQEMAARVAEGLAA
jgi:hypothetical protein